MHPDPRADALIAELSLQPHPEGGWYRRVFRSELQVVRAADSAVRAAATSILYLLKAGEVSRWHRVASDEAWHFYEGAPLELLRGDPALSTIVSLWLGPVAHGRLPVQVIPALHWQAARPLADATNRAAPGYSLVGCTVAPGFDFADFALLADDADACAALQARHPRFASLL